MRGSQRTDVVVYAVVSEGQTGLSLHRVNSGRREKIRLARFDRIDMGGIQRESPVAKNSSVPLPLIETCQIFPG